jgi:hypothetical protein
MINHTNLLKLGVTSKL